MVARWFATVVRGLNITEHGDPTGLAAIGRLPLGCAVVGIRFSMVGYNLKPAALASL
jgi:hypothetical protein